MLTRLTHAYQDLVAQQRLLAPRVVFLPWRGGVPALVGGTDVTYRVWRKAGSERREEALGVLTVLDGKTQEVVEVATARMPVEVPYVPGLLSFRELPVLLRAYATLTRKPELWLVDGGGYAHPRRFGLACHFGLTLGVPALGVAKSRLVGEHGPLALERGSAEFLWDGGERVGVVWRSRRGVRPLYLSVGHLLVLEDVAHLVEGCCRRYRLPEPLRHAHLLGADLRRRLALEERASYDDDVGQNGANDVNDLGADDDGGAV